MSAKSFARKLVTGGLLSLMVLTPVLGTAAPAMADGANCPAGTTFNGTVEYGDQTFLRCRVSSTVTLLVPV